MKIAIISDTHSLLRPEVAEIIRESDHVLHAGDIASPETYEQIRNLMVPVHFVRGNADKEWAEGMPAEAEIALSGYRFYMVHNRSHARKDLTGVDFFVYGHSHKYEERKDGTVTCLNPGSCGPRRFTQPVTMMVLTITEDGAVTIEKIDLSPVLRRSMKRPPKQEMDVLIKHIIKDMNANLPVPEISERNRVEQELVEEILQIYTTHPGINTDGILNRMK
ncbi:MAG: metallophosphoesterase family protein [Lachnospiraceae bacterium]|nr:metallophosphoesterase family protein [Lachnospiraceae bacterium]